MIDKADFRVPGKALFTPEFQKIYAHAADSAVFGSSAAAGIWKKTKYYARSVDLSSYDLPVMLHMECEMTKTRQHKLEILQTGERTYEEMVGLGRRIFQGEPESWGLLRVDLTADKKDVPVQWFKDHTYVAGKQTTREIGTVKPIPYMAIRKGRAETLYAGVKPNQIRIYDKVGERLNRFNKMIQRHVKEAKVLMMEDSMCTIPIHSTFEEMYGHPSDAIITRVERQLAGTDLEKMGLTNVESLRRTQIIQPFKSLRFFQQFPENLSLEFWGFVDWNCGMNLRARVEKDGLNETRMWMKNVLGANFYRDWKKFQPFLHQAAVSGTTASELQKEYENSTRQQFAA